VRIPNPHEARFLAPSCGTPVAIPDATRPVKIAEPHRRIFAFLEDLDASVAGPERSV